jgi:hypothetical protein
MDTRIAEGVDWLVEQIGNVYDGECFLVVRRDRPVLPHRCRRRAQRANRNRQGRAQEAGGRADGARMPACQRSSLTVLAGPQKAQRDRVKKNLEEEARLAAVVRHRDA